MKAMYRTFIKRLLDFLLSLIAIVILSPVMLILIVMVKCRIGSPVFFKQERPGKNEKIFKMYKFRTMTNEIDENGNLLPDIQRLTKFGRFLRNSSLDELPELFNILKGDMSIIGPRPLLIKYLPLYNEKQKHRHDVRPGLTGLAQAHGRNDTTWEKRFDMDVEYVNNITFINDVKILIDTCLSVIKHEGIDSGETSDFTMKEFTGTEGE